MQISELRRQVRDRLHGFAWDQWAQLGVSAATRRTDRWAMDPEALLLFTFEVARTEPRLFDEVLDWLALNQRTISSQRLRNLCRDSADRSLADAALAWVAGARTSGQTSSLTGLPADPKRTLFRHLRLDPERADLAFAAHGWSKHPTERSHKSRSPDLQASINFAFRLRNILGVGARSEVARFLLTVAAPVATAQVVAESAGYAKRNVHEALQLLSAADAVGSVTVGNEQRYHIDRERWAVFLGISAAELPTERSWPQFFYALRQLTRWLEDEQLDGLSPYLRASEARRCAEEILPGLRYAGVRVPVSLRTGTDFWEDFTGMVEAALVALDPQPTIDAARAIATI